MPLDPQIAAILPLIAGAPPLSSGTPERARSGLRLFTVDLRDASKLDPVASTEDVTYPTPDGPRPARVYRPEGAAGPVPTILFVHGGGFIMGDIDTHEDQARMLCHRVGAVVFSIDYRLAPEHPFPAGHLDTVEALRHVCATVDNLGGDPTRIAIAGDSAGGNLSAGAAIAARDEGLPLTAQLLLYPSADFTEAEHPSRIDNAEGYLLTVEDMTFFRDHYVADPADWRASILHHEDLTGVAPAVIATAEYDPLRDEAEAYAAALEKAGTTVVAKRFDGMIHGFFGLGHISEGASKANDEICADLKELLG